MPSLIISGSFPSPYDRDVKDALLASRTLSVRMRAHHRFLANRRM
jgi:hypothetical protein